MTTDIEQNERIVSRIIEDEMKQSYLDYSMSVIIGRALPDIRDGLKPVHRRILYAMYDMGMLHNKPFKKSARIVGEVLGKYHPHGDSAVYESMVRMVQSFSLRYPLIQGQGNFGSIDGDRAAAMRYTEARLNKVSEEMLQDLDKKTVEMVPNFDNSLKEPSILPAKVPNLLVNGSSGIAVGMATNMPPHNLSEVCKGVISIIDNSDISDEELMTNITGPDFPTGGQILGRQGIVDAYKNGRGKITVRAKINVEEAKKTKLIITEIPYMVNKSQLIEDIANLTRDKKITGISDLRDESDKDGLRIMIELKTGANQDIVLNQLYRHTRLQETFGIINLALVDNQPRVLSLKNICSEFIKHRQNIVRKRVEFDLDEAEAKAHLLEGIIIALENIDPVIKLIKAAKNGQEAKAQLIDSYNLSEKQAQAILDMRLQRLTGLEQEKVRAEHSKLQQLIAILKEILGDEQKILDIIKNELNEIIEKYGDDRRTEIIEGASTTLDEEKLIKPEDSVVTITHAGYVKRLPIDTYKQQKRGGRGIVAAETKSDDYVEKLVIANTHDTMLFFTNLGKVHWLKTFKVPETGRYARGTAIVNLLNLGEGEKVTTFSIIKEFSKEKNVFFVTKKGIIKKTSLEEFSRPRAGGIKAINISNGDELINALITDGSKKVMIGTANGLAVKFDESTVRNMGRTAGGVIGIKLKGDDFVVGAIIAEDGLNILTVTEKGYGKRTPVEDYRLINRGGVGVINIKISEKTGKAVSIRGVNSEDEIMLVSQKGILIRIPTKGISIIGRNTQGVRVMKLGSGDKVVGVTSLAE